MGDELRGENLVHLAVGFSTETELKQFQDCCGPPETGQVSTDAKRRTITVDSRKFLQL